MQVTYRCGHSEAVPDDMAVPPQCLQCRERRVTRVEARPPRIRGWAVGPHCETERLDAVPVAAGSGLQLTSGTRVQHAPRKR